MRLDLLKYDKNGQSTRGDMYCHKCTGEFRLMRSKKTGRGRMKCIRLVTSPRYATPHYQFKCVICGYNRIYAERYQDDYGIKTR